MTKIGQAKRRQMQKTEGAEFGRGLVRTSTPEEYSSVKSERTMTTRSSSSILLGLFILMAVLVVVIVEICRALLCGEVFMSSATTKTSMASYDQKATPDALA